MFVREFSSTCKKIRGEDIANIMIQIIYPLLFITDQHCNHFMQSLSLAPYIAINTMDILRTTIINKPAIVCFVTSKDFFFF